MIKYVATTIIGVLIGAGAMSVLGGTENKTAPNAEVVPVEVSQQAVDTQVVTEASAPAYMIVLGDVTDRDAFGAGYVSKLPPLYEKYGASYIAVGGGVEVLEGEYAPQSYVIGKWPSIEVAKEFWDSPEYEELKRARIDGGWADFDVLLVQGLPESQ
ncbi:DUF1330 domain-containing protein [Hirschia litorea]|uniref:DUF1330 domain-containing protein n=1 Tax=Hirschia litorea TaxID=1199156 RepID=A0ABW2IGU2_9PROT